MEDYLCPILSQFDFSCFGHQTPSISIPECIRPKDKEEKAGLDKGLAVGSPAELGEYVVLLADWMLMELPLEALAILQEEGLSSVSRDFSLQLLHTRLQREEPVESDNKKETKGGKGAKGKVDQSKAIKMVPVNRVLPPNTLPVDTHNFKCIFYLFDFNNDLLTPPISISLIFSGEIIYISRNFLDGYFLNISTARRGLATPQCAWFLSRLFPMFLLSRAFPRHSASTYALLALWGLTLDICKALCDNCLCRNGFMKFDLGNKIVSNARPVTYCGENCP
uniref:Cilia and flagella associated protein 46 n=1 Tax=Oncorhynchus mykiss TaxID=8022 RepID=A0A8K9XHR6_ONCMY